MVLSLRERNRLEAMRRVQALAVEQFTADGFDAVTVDTIARAAGLSTATVYRYFGTKEHIVLWDGVEDGVRAELSARSSSDDPLRVLERAVRAHLVDDAANLARMRLAYETPTIVAASLAEFARLRSTIADALGGSFDDDVRASAALAAIDAAIDRWQREGRLGELDDCIARAFTVLARGWRRARP